MPSWHPVNWPTNVGVMQAMKALYGARVRYPLIQFKSASIAWRPVFESRYQPNTGLGGLKSKSTHAGMRNSNVMAIAPTATISNICGVAQSIEPTYQNLYVKSNLSGEFTVINPYLVSDLKKPWSWDEVMVNDLKYYDGSVQAISRIPNALKIAMRQHLKLIHPGWFMQDQDGRNGWIKPVVEYYMRKPSGKKLDDLYKLCC